MIRNIIEKRILIQMENKNKLITKMKLWYEFNFNVKKMIQSIDEVKYDDLMLIFGLLYHNEFSYHNMEWNIIKIDDNGHKIVLEYKESIIVIFLYKPNNSGNSYIDITMTNKNNNNEYKTGYWYREKHIQEYIKKFIYEIMKRYYKGEI